MACKLLQPDSATGKADDDMDEDVAGAGSQAAAAAPTFLGIHLPSLSLTLSVCLSII